MRSPRAGRRRGRGRLARAIEIGTLLVAATLSSWIAPLAAGTLDAVRTRGTLRCGVAEGPPGLAAEVDGTWRGFDVDFCRAFAAAVLGNAASAEIVPLDPEAGVEALAEARVDVLARQPSGRLGRPADPRTASTALTFWDGQGFLVPVEEHLSIARELDGSTICVEAGGDAERNLRDFAQRSEITVSPLRFKREGEAAAAYFTGHCRALTAGRLALAFYRRGAKLAEQHVLLPDSISKQPMGPLVRADDRSWQEIIRWTSFALIEAEEQGVTSKNAAELRDGSSDEGVRRLLGVSGDFGSALGLDPGWAFQAILQVGNYGEIYQRHLGAEAGIGLERGPNALMPDGGLLQAMPFR